MSASNPAAGAMEIIESFSGRLSCSEMRVRGDDLVDHLRELVDQTRRQNQIITALTETEGEVVEVMSREGCISNDEATEASDIIETTIQFVEDGLPGDARRVIADLADIIGEHEFNVFCRGAPNERELEVEMTALIQLEPGAPKSISGFESDGRVGACVIVEKAAREM